MGGDESLVADAKLLPERAQDPVQKFSRCIAAQLIRFGLLAGKVDGGESLFIVVGQHLFASPGRNRRVGHVAGTQPGRFD